MDTRKRWHLWIICGVLLLTLYNILPTIFFYTKPLNEPVGPATAHQVVEQIGTRVNAMEAEALSYVNAYAKNLNLKVYSIDQVEEDPGLIRVKFAKHTDAERFKRYFPRAGALIPFAPAQLTLGQQTDHAPADTVMVRRMVSTHFTKDGLEKSFTFSEKRDGDGAITPLYQEIVNDRAEALADLIGGESQTAQLLSALATPGMPLQKDALLSVAQEIVQYEKTFGLDSPITKRYYGSFTGTAGADRDTLIPTLISGLEKVDGEVEGREKDLVQGALTIIKGNTSLFNAGSKPTKSLDFGDRNPFIRGLDIDLDNEQLTLLLHEDVEALRTRGGYLADQVDAMVLNEMGTLGRMSSEKIRPDGANFAINLSHLTGSQSFLAMDLGAIAEQKSHTVLQRIESSWNPTQTDLVRERFPLLDYASFKELSPQEQKLGLVVYAPAMSDETPPQGFRESSLYVIARGIGTIAEKEDVKLADELEHLRTLLAQDGFLAYSGAEYGIAPAFKDDVIFELPNYYDDLLAATREDFTVHGSSRYATLEFSTEKQRLMAINEIETKTHEDLLKWRDNYQKAKVDRQLQAKYEVPPPTKSVLWDNLRLSARKYFRGDERKTLNWGLDLSGGKSVTLALVDGHNRPVTNPTDLRQGINELQSRVNKMGVSEVEIRQEGDNIVLNFPGAQGLSASDLVKASTMTFHIVNEQFARQNSAVASSVDRFLQEVWNESQVTGRTGIDQINQIAFARLGGEDEEAARPRTEAAQTLFDAGLRLANPEAEYISSAFNDELSAIAMWRGEDFAEWQGAANPLMVVFANYALEGTSLENVHAQYDSSKGNVLVFGVQGSATSEGMQINPRNDLHTWTSHFAEDRIIGTPKESYSNGRGWRMAVILNGQVISAPSLNSTLRDHAQVTGNFSTQEVNALVADLKAGSMTFTPKILSEKNVSPDLGKSERQQGIYAAAIGLLLVFGAMAWYYRFAGLVAGCALFFNLLIMWGVLQNLDAALTLPGIAGIILTVGMAVDANVLVFERIREEFSISGRLSAAVQTGYKKAFSAIIDSNITTLIAAFILLHFDAGPIKGFAITLIIGIISSMFTALFMTRYFFSGWVMNPKRRELKMLNLFKRTKFDFLGKAKVAITGACVVIAVGLAMLFMQQKTMFGMDFTGGYALNVQLEEQADTDYRTAAMSALVKAGAPASDIQIRQLNRGNQLRIQLGMGLEQAGRPFHGMHDARDGDNPRIDWVVSALESAGLTIKPGVNLENQWNVISGQLSDTMRNSAIWGLGLALLAILVYITIRFEFKYAISAIVALAHDLAITVGAMAILHWMGVRVQIDLQVVGALMTIIGYSLNDTIVIFDRIREDTRVLRKLSFSELINSALNSTLNRTLITSGTTLLVLLALVSLGGAAIFDFALVMTMGVVFGTISSLFIASPVLLYFHNREASVSSVAKAA